MWDCQIESKLNHRFSRTLGVAGSKQVPFVSILGTFLVKCFWDSLVGSQAENTEDARAGEVTLF